MAFCFDLSVLCVFCWLLHYAVHFNGIFLFMPYKYQTLYYLSSAPFFCLYVFSGVIACCLGFQYYVYFKCIFLFVKKNTVLLLLCAVFVLYVFVCCFLYMMLVAIRCSVQLFSGIIVFILTLYYHSFFLPLHGSLSSFLFCVCIFSILLILMVWLWVFYILLLLLFCAFVSFLLF